MVEHYTPKERTGLGATAYELGEGASGTLSGGVKGFLLGWVASIAIGVGLGAWITGGAAAAMVIGGVVGAFPMFGAAVGGVFAVVGAALGFVDGKDQGAAHVKEHNLAVRMERARNAELDVYKQFAQAKMMGAQSQAMQAEAQMANAQATAMHAYSTMHATQNGQEPEDKPSMSVNAASIQGAERLQAAPLEQGQAL